MSELIELTRQLVQADTVSDQPNAAIFGALADRLEGLGLSVRLQLLGGDGEPAKANLVAVAGPAAPGGLVLSGHMDVVPFAGQPGWTREPLGLTAAGDRLYGRGTSDMKGFLAQCVEAIRRLDPGSLTLPVVLLFTSDEEVGCRGAERLVPDLPDLLGDVPLPRLAWIGEPTSWRIFHAHKGIAEFEVRVIGSGGHSSVPEAGVNAIAVAGRAIAAIGALQEELRAERRAEWEALFPAAPYTTFNFGTIRGGTASNMIAEACSFRVSYRPLPDEDPRSVWQRVRERIEAMEARDWGSPDLRGEVTLSEPLLVPGMDSPRGSALEGALFDVLEETTSAGAPYCTDGGQFARAGIDSLICGPGDLDQAHQPDESIQRAALERGPDLILRVLERLCGAKPR
jgi:acetylornithine deacetylase